MKTAQLVPSYDDVREYKSWVGGPTNILQRQHIPGYQGHIHSLQSESLHGKTFARISAECLNSRNNTGFEIENKERFQTSYKQEYQKPNLRNQLLQNTADTVLNQVKINQEISYQAQKKAYNQAPKTINDIQPIDRVPIIGYQGYRPVFKYPIKQVVAPNEPQRRTDGFFGLPHETQRNLLDNDEKLLEQIKPRDEPVVGYTGFQSGVKAENIFGCPFQNQVGQSETFYHVNKNR